MDKYQHFRQEYNNSQSLLKNKRQREEDPEGQEPSKRAKIEDDDEAANVDKWEAPEGQTGDGKTRLNARFGY